MLVSPSVMSCDLGKLAEELEKCERGGADSIHVDVMDGHFVPNFALGVESVRAIKRYTSLPLEIHLMVERPDIYWKPFMEAGGSRFLIHFESQADILGTIRKIREAGCEPGLAVNPETRFSTVSGMMHELDYLLIMTIHPGFSSQKFMDEVVPKIRESSAFVAANRLDTVIEIDGGVNLETGLVCADAGAGALASASYVFRGDTVENIRKLKNLKQRIKPA